MRARAAGRRVELCHDAELPAERTFDDVTVLDEVEIVQRLLRGLILVRHDPAVSDEHRHPLGCRPGLHVGQHSIAKCFTRVVAPQHWLIAEFGEYVGEPDAVQETFEQMRQQVAELQPSSIGALHRVIVDRRHHGERICAERRQFETALLQLRHEQAAHFVRQQSPCQIRLESTAVAVDGARIEAGHDAGTRRLSDRMRGHLNGTEDRTIAIHDAAEADHAAEPRGD